MSDNNNVPSRDSPETPVLFQQIEDLKTQIHELEVKYYYFSKSADKRLTLQHEAKKVGLNYGFNYDFCIVMVEDEELTYIERWNYCPQCSMCSGREDCPNYGKEFWTIQNPRCKEYGFIPDCGYRSPLTPYNATVLGLTPEQIEYLNWTHKYMEEYDNYSKNETPFKDIESFIAHCKETAEPIYHRFMNK